MLKVEDAPALSPFRKLMSPAPEAALAAPVRSSAPVKLVLVETVTPSEAAFCVPVPWNATTSPEVIVTAPRRVLAPTLSLIVMSLAVAVPAFSVRSSLPALLPSIVVA